MTVNAGSNTPDHAFAVLAYGDSPFLEGCLASLAAQTVTSRIVITTSTPSEFIAGVALRAGVPMCANSVRGTIASDWNFGLRATGARYVTLAHQDDTYAPTFLAETLAAFSAGPGALCFSGYQEIDDAGAAISSKISRVKHLIEATTLGASRSVSGWRLRAFLSFGNPLPCSSVTYDLSQLVDFSFSADFASNLDWDAWWILMASRATFRRAPGRLVGRRHNQMTETSRLLKDGTRRREDLAMFRRAWPWPIADLIARLYRAGY